MGRETRKSCLMCTALLTNWMVKTQKDTTKNPLAFLLLFANFFLNYPSLQSKTKTHRWLDFVWK